MINKLTVKELKTMAAEANVQGRTKMTKDELLNALRTTRKFALILDYMEDYNISLEEATDMARH